MMQEPVDCLLDLTHAAPYLFFRTLMPVSKVVNRLVPALWRLGASGANAVLLCKWSMVIVDHVNEKAKVP